jgi:hypothetical protein
MWLKNPLTGHHGALCKTRQENAEVYRPGHFAENLYSRAEAIPIDQLEGIIGLLDQRPVNQLLAAASEPDEPELWKVLKNRKCGTCSAPGNDGKVVDFYKAMCAPLEGGSGRGPTLGLPKLLEVAQHIWRYIRARSHGGAFRRERR